MRLRPVGHDRISSSATSSPGGMLPGPAMPEKVVERSGLKRIGQHVFAQVHARTLAEWRERLLSARNDIVPLGFEERFRRLATFCLDYREAGFRAEPIDLRQTINMA